MNYRVIAINDSGEQLAYALEGGRNPAEALSVASEKVAREIHKKIASGEICYACENTGLVLSTDETEQVPCVECYGPSDPRDDHPSPQDVYGPAQLGMK